MKVLLTASETTVRENQELLRKSKLDFIYFPTIEFRALPTENLSLESYEWLIISSRKVFDFLSDIVDLGSFRELKIASVGAVTSEYMNKKGVKVDFTSTVYSGEGFAKGFIEKYRSINGKALRPVSTLADDTPDRILAKAGIIVDRVCIYETVVPIYSPSRIEELSVNDFSAIIFSSPSTWENFKRLLSDGLDLIIKGKLLCVMGPSTAKALEKDGYQYIMPDRYTLKDLIEKLEGELL